MTFDVFVVVVATFCVVIWAVTKICDTWVSVTHTKRLDRLGEPYVGTQEGFDGDK